MELTVLDAGVIIGFLDARDARHDAARAALADAGGRGDRLVLPVSAYAEALVGPARREEAAVEALIEFIARVPIAVAPLDEEIALVAARMRARHRERLKLPDALVVATAVVLDADVLVTSDRAWPSRRSLGLRARIVKL